MKIVLFIKRFLILKVMKLSLFAHLICGDYSFIVQYIKNKINLKEKNLFSSQEQVICFNVYHKHCLPRKLKKKIT